MRTSTAGMRTDMALDLMHIEVMQEEAYYVHLNCYRLCTCYYPNVTIGHLD